jgi:hypothetical protein
MRAMMRMKILGMKVNAVEVRMELRKIAGAHTKCATGAMPGGLFWECGWSERREKESPSVFLQFRPISRLP